MDDLNKMFGDHVVKDEPVEVPVETPEKVETTENIVETPTEIPVETPVEQNTEEVPKEEKVTTEFDGFKWLEEKAGKKFKDENELKEFFEKPKDEVYADTLRESIKKEIEESHKTELESLKKTLEQVDVRKILGEEGYRNLMVRQQLGDNVNSGMLEKVMKGEIDNFDPLSKAAAKLMFENKNIQPQDAIAIIKKRVTGDPDFDATEFTGVHHAELQIMAQEASGYFDKIKKMEIPKIEDVDLKESEQKRSEYISSLKENWKESLDDIFNDFNSIGSKEVDGLEELKDFKFSIGSGDKKLLKEATEAYLINNGLEVNDENKELALKFAQDQYGIVNRDKIEKAKLKHLKDKLVEQHHKSVHNEKEVNKSVNPAKETAGSKEEIQRNSFKNAGLI